MKQAIVAVIRDESRVLVILRGRAVERPGTWGPLSGRIERGETQQDALVREVLEEVGLVVRPGRKVWECPADGAAFHLNWWTAEVVGGTLRPDGVEVEDARWVTAEEFRALAPTFEADHEFFERVLPTLDRVEAREVEAREKERESS